MSIFKVVAQAVNFVVFVGVLYVLLYKPVRRIMKQRKDEMEADLRQAEKDREEAEKLREEAEKRAREIEDTRDAILKETREQAEKQRQELLDQAGQEARERLERFRRIMEQERDDLLGNVTGDLRDTVVQVASAILKDSAQDLTQKSIDRLLGMVEQMPEDDTANARKALAQVENRVSVRSASKLTDEQVERIRQAIHQKIGVEEIKIDMDEDPSLLAGVEAVIGHVNLEAHWRGVIDEALQARSPSK